MKGKAKFKFDHWTAADEPVPEEEKEKRPLELDASGGFGTGVILTGQVDISPEEVHHIVSMLRQGKVPVFVMELNE